MKALALWRKKLASQRNSGGNQRNGVAVSASSAAGENENNGGVSQPISQ
jgi:hypothetical protein